MQQGEESPFAFSFIEGSLINAIKNGKKCFLFLRFDLTLLTMVVNVNLLLTIDRILDFVG